MPTIAFHRSIALGKSHRFSDIGKSGKSLGIFDGQWPYRPENPYRAAESGGLAGIDADESGPELGELGQHKAVDALADGGEQHDRRNADGDTQGGERRPHSVSKNRTRGQFEKVIPQHCTNIY